MRGCKGSGMFQCREAKAERGCVAAYKNVRGVNTREELLMLKDNIGMRTSENKLVMNKCRLWTTERFVTMGGEQLGFCFPKGALEHKQSWFCVQHHFCLSAESRGPFPCWNPPQGVLTSTSRVNSAGALCFLPFLLICSGGVGKWSRELRALLEVQHPGMCWSCCGRHKPLSVSSVDIYLHPRSTHLHCPPVPRDTEHLSDRNHISVTQIQKNTGKGMFGGLREDDAAWAIILPGASVQDHFLPSLGTADKEDVGWALWQKL